MIPGPGGLDRLLRRHEVPLDTLIEWNVVRGRRVFGRESESSVSARVLDLSLEGALIEAPTPPQHTVNDRVEVRYQGHSAIARIRHIRHSPAAASAFYGVHLTMSREFQQAVAALTGRLRGNEQELQQQWERER